MPGTDCAWHLFLCNTKLGPPKQPGRIRRATGKKPKLRLVWALDFSRNRVKINRNFYVTTCPTPGGALQRRPHAAAVKTFFVSHPAAKGERRMNMDDSEIWMNLEAGEMSAEKLYGRQVVTLSLTIAYAGYLSSREVEGPAL